MIIIKKGILNSKENKVGKKWKVKYPHKRFTHILISRRINVSEIPRTEIILKRHRIFSFSANSNTGAPAAIQVVGRQFLLHEQVDSYQDYTKSVHDSFLFQLSIFQSIIHLSENNELLWYFSDWKLFWISFWINRVMLFSLNCDYYSLQFSSTFSNPYDKRRTIWMEEMAYHGSRLITLKQGC